MDLDSFRFMHTKHHISKVTINILVLVIVFFAVSICVWMGFNVKALKILENMRCKT